MTKDVSKRCNKFRTVVESRDPRKMFDAVLLGKMTVFNIDFVTRFDMVCSERNWND